MRVLVTSVMRLEFETNLFGEMKQELLNQETDRLAETSNDNIDEWFELAGFDILNIYTHPRGIIFT